MQFGSRLFGSFGRAFVSPAVKVVLQSTALLALLALAGCPAASTAGNTNPPATPPSASTVVVQAISTTAFNSIDAGSLSLNATGSLGGASRIAYFGFIESQLIQADLALTLTSWTESTPSSYTSAGINITWSQNGDSWTWSFTLNSNMIVITLTSTSSGWNVNVTNNGATWLTGSINSSGTQGSVTLSDPTGAVNGSVTAVWTTASSPYNYQFTMTATGQFANEAGDGATSATLILQTNSAGSAYKWTYTDNAGGSDSYPVT